MKMLQLTKLGNYIVVVALSCSTPLVVVEGFKGRLRMMENQVTVTRTDVRSEPGRRTDLNIGGKLLLNFSLNEKHFLNEKEKTLEPEQGIEYEEQKQYTSDLEQRYEAQCEKWTDDKNYQYISEKARGKNQLYDYQTKLQEYQDQIKLFEQQQQNEVDEPEPHLLRILGEEIKVLPSYFKKINKTETDDEKLPQTRHLHFTRQVSEVRKQDGPNCRLHQRTTMLNNILGDKSNIFHRGNIQRFLKKQDLWKRLFRDFQTGQDQEKDILTFLKKQDLMQRPQYDLLFNKNKSYSYFCDPIIDHQVEELVEDKINQSLFLASWKDRKQFFGNQETVQGAGLPETRLLLEAISLGMKVEVVINPSGVNALLDYVAYHKILRRRRDCVQASLPRLFSREVIHQLIPEKPNQNSIAHQMAIVDIKQRCKICRDWCDGEGDEKCRGPSEYVNLPYNKDLLLKIKNSWGKGSGCNGYVYVSMKDFRKYFAPTTYKLYLQYNFPKTESSVQGQDGVSVKPEHPHLQRSDKFRRMQEDLGIYLTVPRLRVRDPKTCKSQVQNLKRGQLVEVNYLGKGKWYEARIQRKINGSDYRVNWGDGQVSNVLQKNIRVPYWYWMSVQKEKLDQIQKDEINKTYGRYRFFQNNKANNVHWGTAYFKLKNKKDFEDKFEKFYENEIKENKRMSEYFEFNNKLVKQGVDLQSLTKFFLNDQDSLQYDEIKNDLEVGDKVVAYCNDGELAYAKILKKTLMYNDVDEKNQKAEDFYYTVEWNGVDDPNSQPQCIIQDRIVKQIEYENHLSFENFQKMFVDNN